MGEGTLRECLQGLGCISKYGNPKYGNPFKNSHKIAENQEKIGVGAYC